METQGIGVNIVSIVFNVCAGMVFVAQKAAEPFNACEGGAKLMIDHRDEVALQRVTSYTVLMPCSTLSISMGCRLMSTGNSVPFLRCPKSWRPTPIERVS